MRTTLISITELPALEMIDISKNVKISEIFTPNTRSLLKLETQNVISKQNGETTMEFQKSRTFSEIDSGYHRATTIIETPPYGYSALWLLRLMASPPYGCFISATRQYFRADLQPTSVRDTDFHYTLGVDYSGPGFPPALCPVRLHSQVSMPGEPDRRYARSRASTQNTLRYGSVRNATRFDMVMKMYTP